MGQMESIGAYLAPLVHHGCTLERLIGAHIKQDADNGRERTVRELVAEFRGLSATAKQKLVLDATGLARAPLSALIEGNGFDHRKIKKLLAAMKEQSQPVKPEMLGSIGKEHFRTAPRRRWLRDGDPSSIAASYRPRTTSRGSSKRRSRGARKQRSAA